MKSIEDVSQILYTELDRVFKNAVTPNHRILVESIGDSKDFLAFNSSKYDLSYNIGIMLTFPKLWLNFKAKDWKETISMRPERNLIKDLIEFQDSGIYSDLVFLHKILQLDTLRLLDKYDLVSKETKLNYEDYLRRFSIMLNYNKEEFKADLIEFYDTSFEEIDNCKEKLIKEGFPKLEY